MDKILGLFLGLALVVLGVVIMPTAANATEKQDDKCYDKVLDKEAYDETVTIKEAWDEKVIDTPGRAAVPAKDAVYEVLYEFQHKHGQTKWNSNPNWNAESNPESVGWTKTGATKNGELISPAVPAQAAVEEVSHIVKHLAETKVVHHDATYKDVPVSCPENVEGFIDLAWLLPEGAPADNTDPSIWPQTPYTGDYSPKCETYVVQKDRYRYYNQAEKLIIESFDDDGYLTNGEDHEYVVGWEFVTVEGDPALCDNTPPKPDPIVRVVTGEDVYVCGDDFYTTQTMTVTTDFELVNNVWVQLEPVVKYEYVRTPTDIIDCALLPPIVEVITEEDTDCTDEVVKITTKTTLTPYILVDHKPVLGTRGETVTKVETRKTTREDCPVVDNPPVKDSPNPKGDIATPISEEAPKAPSEPVEEVSGVLPNTGAPEVLGVLVLGIALLAGGTVLVLRLAKTNKE